MSDSEFNPREEGRDVPVDPEVTLELYRAWRTPREGRANPERMSNPVWEWLIRSRLDAYSAAQKFNCSSTVEEGPGWCFNRFGQTSTMLPDGRVVLIAGEHEDHYDPDFCIYNDVVVQHPNGRVDILGYPAAVFPPTDFHTATLVDGRIILIGCLGYPERRKPGTTQILTLDLTTFSVSLVRTSGTAPGWIHRHEAHLEEDGTAIHVKGGTIDPGGAKASLIENIDEWRLHLANWRWERLTERRWLRWEIMRKDRRPNHLWDIQQAIWSRSVGWEKELEEQMEALTRELKKRPDLELAERLFRPPLAHEEVRSAQREFSVVRIQADGVIIRYVTNLYSVQLTVEGELPISSAQVLTCDLCEKLAALENAPVEANPI